MNQSDTPAAPTATRGRLKLAAAILLALALLIWLVYVHQIHRPPPMACPPGEDTYYYNGLMILAWPKGWWPTEIGCAPEGYNPHSNELRRLLPEHPKGSNPHEPAG